MKIIVGGRASGKTTKLIQESAETGYRIIAFSHDAAREIYMQAKDLGYDILRPISVMEYVLAPDSFEQDGVLIDDLENTLETLFKQKMHAATFCAERMPLCEVSTRGTLPPNLYAVKRFSKLSASLSYATRILSLKNASKYIE